MASRNSRIRLRTVTLGMRKLLSSFAPVDGDVSCVSSHCTVVGVRRVRVRVRVRVRGRARDHGPVVRVGVRGEGQHQRWELGLGLGKGFEPKPARRPA